MDETEIQEGPAAPGLMRQILLSFDQAWTTNYLTGDSIGMPDELINMRAKTVDEIGSLGLFQLAIAPYSSFRAEGVYIRREIALLNDRVQKLEERIQNLELSIVEGSVTILREVSREEAEQEIIRLFSEGQIMYYSDIAAELRLDLELIVDICSDLQRRGEIAVIADVSE